ncbi:hypothetical protein N9C48_01060 [bacterium]|nr:hypothetical protein [bacterium]
MKKIMYFLKWNFTGMEGYSKRYLSYLALGFAASFTIGAEYFYITPAFMFIDFTVDIVRQRYQDFKDEQQKLIDDLSK